MKDDDDEDFGDDAETSAPPCPYCGDDSVEDDRDGARCPHLVALVRDGDEFLPLVPEWNEIDDLASDLRRLTKDGDAVLDAMMGRPETWWLASRDAGFGSSGRLAGADAVAARFKLAGTPADGGLTAYFVEDPAAFVARLRGVLARVKSELTTLARRYDVDDAV